MFQWSPNCACCGGDPCAKPCTLPASNLKLNWQYNDNTCTCQGLISTLARTFGSPCSYQYYVQYISTTIGFGQYYGNIPYPYTYHGFTVKNNGTNWQLIYSAQNPSPFLYCQFVWNLVSTSCSPLLLSLGTLASFMTNATDFQPIFQISGSSCVITNVSVSNPSTWPVPYNLCALTITT